MFTGIVTDVGKVKRVEKRGDTHIVIATHYDVERHRHRRVDRMLGDLPDRDRQGPRRRSLVRGCRLGRDGGEDHDRRAGKSGQTVNLERPLRLGDELGGHIVAGHVDGVAEIARIAPEGESKRITFAAPKELLRFIAPKGSVALDGVSLTVNEVERGEFGVNIIPHTLKVTTFGGAKKGSKLNLEVDLLARYVARLAKR